MDHWNTMSIPGLRGQSKKKLSQGRGCAKRLEVFRLKGIKML